jgi:16S rRNA (guanine(966)-N(2))-methyltransferase RsmD
MRITGGQARGKLIAAQKGMLVRPTADRVRESLFDILTAIAGKSFLDIFAGSGIVGLEALSRGAADVVFIEKNSRIAKKLKDNIEHIGFALKAEVIAAPAAQAIEALLLRGKRFDILFADPPYNKGMVGEVLGFNNLEKLMAEDALFILQHSKKESIGELKTDALLLRDQRKYSDTVLSFFERE